jgi:hypothetical protein
MAWSRGAKDAHAAHTVAELGRGEAFMKIQLVEAGADGIRCCAG